MATSTAGTKATTTLVGAQFPGRYGADSISDADIAEITNAIKNDQNWPAAWPGAFSRMGLLYVPNRGVLKLQQGDWVLYGPDGFPYLVPEIALPTTLTATGDTHTTTTVDNLSTDVRALGWKPGALIAGANITAGTLIESIAADGLSLVLSAAASGSGVADTLTVGSFTHS